MPKLNDTQTILLSTASQRESYSLYPLLEAQAKGGVRVTKAITGLLSAGFAEERETEAVEATSRLDGDIRYGLFATAAGLAAIGVEPDAGQGSQPEATPAVSATDEPRVTKAEAVLTLLKRETGASLPDLIAATGWLPHTTRAALTGLRKKGHAIERFKHEAVTTYRIAG